jgi:hypothetical protein
MPLTKWSESEDHLDPVWKEGRDYQLVCGLNLTCNLRQEVVGANSRKSNRFTPWRTFGVCPPPEEPGDLCWFLNLETEEWEFISWLGDRWFQLTRKTCSEYFNGLANGPMYGGWNRGLTNEPRGTFKPGYLWYNNGEVNTRVLEGDRVPSGFVRGRLCRNARNDKGQFIRSS